jgi:hypothetical protein
VVAFYLDNASLDELPSPPSYPYSFHPDQAGASLQYDDIIDSLIILFDDRPTTRVVEPINAYASLLIDDDTDRVVGAMVEAFLTHAVHDHPELQPIASYMRLGSRPHGDTDLFRTDHPERSVQPDEAWQAEAVRAIRDLFEITGGPET